MFCQREDRRWVLSLLVVRYPSLELGSVDSLPPQPSEAQTCCDSVYHPAVLVRVREAFFAAFFILRRSPKLLGGLELVIFRICFSWQNN